MFTAFLIKYAEIGIKGRNRYLFVDQEFSFAPLQGKLNLVYQRILK